MVKAFNNNVIKSHEHQDYAWIGLNEIEKYNLTDATKKTIKEGFSLISKIDFSDTNVK